MAAAAASMPKPRAVPHNQHIRAVAQFSVVDHPAFLFGVRACHEHAANPPCQTAGMPEDGIENSHKQIWHTTSQPARHPPHNGENLKTDAAIPLAPAVRPLAAMPPTMCRSTYSNRGFRNRSSIAGTRRKMMPSDPSLPESTGTAIGPAICAWTSSGRRAESLLTPHLNHGGFLLTRHFTVASPRRGLNEHHRRNASCIPWGGMVSMSRAGLSASDRYSRGSRWSN